MVEVEKVYDYELRETYYEVRLSGKWLARFAGLSDARDFAHKVARRIKLYHVSFKVGDEF